MHRVNAAADIGMYADSREHVESQHANCYYT